MSEKERIETAEVDEPEAVSEVALVPQDESMSGDGMDAVIAVAQKMESYTKAMDTIVNAIIKRAYVGDWVCHARADTKPEDRKANIGSAAAERIAAFLGIGERSWTPGLRSVSDDGKFFTWTFEADFGFGKRWIHAIGRASSKDKFFGYANGQWKPIEDVKEDDVRMAAFRACRKEGVRALLGLRAIPVSKLQELGYPVDRVRFVGFEDKGKKLSADETKAGSDGLVEKTIIVLKLDRMEWNKKDPKTKKPTGEKGVRYIVTDKENVKYNLWAGDESTRVQQLSMREDDKLPVKVWFKVGEFNGNQTYQIEKVEGVEEAGQ